MKVIAFLILALQVFVCLHAIELLKDYGHIQGVCHALRKGTTILKRDLSYAKRLNINSTRVWLSYYKGRIVAINGSIVFIYRHYKSCKTRFERIVMVCEKIVPLA